MESLKRIDAIVAAPPSHWVGDGLLVRSLISHHSQGAAISPFLLLDYAAPKEFAPAPVPRGVGEHPHRGFETVTIVYQGELAHRDSAGNQGTLGPGDVQWMTAASGIVHEEFHSQDFTDRGGTLEMVQLWVNLPARHKMSPPGYQELRKQEIPTVELPGGAGQVRVIAGEFQGTKGPARTFTRVNLWDTRLKAGTTCEFTMPEGDTTMALVLSGRVTVAGTESLGAADLAIFERKGSRLALDAQEDTAILILGGQPIDEPIASYGPFVMNTKDEIQQAVRDFQAGRFARIE
jgi:hypothetical protein